MSFAGQTTALTYIINILIGNLSHPCALFEFQFLKMTIILLSLTFNDESILSVPRIKVGKILGLDRDVYCDVKKAID